MEDHKTLAISEDFGLVTECPGGIIHVHLHHMTLKFMPNDFVKLTDLLNKARAQCDAPQKGCGKPHLQIVGPPPTDTPE
jgi:hypothetical protein